MTATAVMAPTEREKYEIRTEDRVKPTACEKDDRRPRQDQILTRKMD